MATKLLVPYFPGAASREDAPVAGHLQIVNLSATSAVATITGRDAAGSAGAHSFTTNAIPAYGNIRVTAGHLEGGGEAGASNGLGNGRGVWALTIDSDSDLAVVAFLGSAADMRPLPVASLLQASADPPAITIQGPVEVAFLRRAILEHSSGFRIPNRAARAPPA